VPHDTGTLEAGLLQYFPAGQMAQTVLVEVEQLVWV